MLKPIELSKAGMAELDKIYDIIYSTGDNKVLFKEIFQSVDDDKTKISRLQVIPYINLLSLCSKLRLTLGEQRTFLSQDFVKSLLAE